MFNLKIPVELDPFGLGCAGEDDCETGEVGERELVLVVSVRCGKERDMPRG